MKSLRNRFGPLLLLAAVVGGVHGLLYVPYAGHVLGDSPSYSTPAHAILHGSYSTPLPAIDVTGLVIPASARGAPERQTYRTPGYPLVLALAGGGTSKRSVDAVIGVQAVLSGLAVFLLGLAFRRLWGDVVALGGAWLAALDPFTKHYVTRVLSEVLATFLVAAAVYAFVRAWQDRERLWWAAFGAAAAALTLTRPLFLFALPLTAIVLLVRRDWRAVVAIGTAAGVLLTPWLAWTTAATGRPALQSFGEGWNLLLAAHGEGLANTAVDVERSSAFKRDFDSVHALAPTAAELRSDPDAHPGYLARADAHQRDLAFDVYGHRLEHEPLQVLGEIAYRGYFLWMAHEDWRQPGGVALTGLRALDWLTLALVAVGCGFALRVRGPGGALAAFLVLFTLINAVHHVEARYAMPVRELALGYVALAIAPAITRRDRR